jgi:hypothetical protein
VEASRVVDAVEVVAHPEIVDAIEIVAQPEIVDVAWPMKNT